MVEALELAGKEYISGMTRLCVSEVIDIGICKQMMKRIQRSIFDMAGKGGINSTEQLGGSIQENIPNKKPAIQSKSPARTAGELGKHSNLKKDWWRELSSSTT